MVCRSLHSLQKQLAEADSASGVRQGSCGTGSELSLAGVQLSGVAPTEVHAAAQVLLPDGFGRIAQHS